MEQRDPLRQLPDVLDPLVHTMNGAAERIYRTAAVGQLSSPEQLDQLVRITRPFDWVAGCVIFLGIAVLVTWSLAGRVATRVSGEGIMISSGGRVVGATANTTGRLASIEVSIGDRVTRGQIIARVAQTDTEQRHHSAIDTLREREHEHAESVSAIEREIAAKIANFAAQRAGLSEAIAAAERRATHLLAAIAQLERDEEQNFATRQAAEDRRRDLAEAQQRIADARKEILRLEALRVDLEALRARERLSSKFQVDEAQRQVDRLAAALDHHSVVRSPIDGRVIEIKSSEGAMLADGTPVIEIESEGIGLAAVIYLAADRGKSVHLGMEARVEPASIKREEFCTLIGKVASISDYPVTPQGMAAVLRNETLVTRFSRDGASYAVVVELQRDERAMGGYRWTSGAGPPSLLTTGTLVRAEITTSEQPPINLVVPFLKRASGTGG